MENRLVLMHPCICMGRFVSPSVCLSKPFFFVFAQRGKMLKNDPLHLCNLPLSVYQLSVSMCISISLSHSFFFNFFIQSLHEVKNFDLPNVSFISRNQHLKAIQFCGQDGGTVFKCGGRPVASRGVMADFGANVTYAGGTPIGNSIRQLKILPSG